VPYRTSPIHVPERESGSASDRGVAPIDATRLSRLDFAHFGLFWDRPGMNNDRFLAILSDPSNPEHRWAWVRTLERIPSSVLTRNVTLSELQRIIRLVRLRPPLQGAWESAIDYWSQETRRRPE